MNLFSLGSQGAHHVRVSLSDDVQVVANRYTAITMSRITD